MATAIAEFSPSPQQSAIFDNISDGEGNTVIVARAGSGKTTTIMQGMNFIPQRQRQRTLMVAFNKSIATELQSRAPEGVQVSTLHSYGLRQISCNLPKRPQIDADKMVGIVNRLTANRELKACLRKIASFCKASLSHSKDAIDGVIDTQGILIPMGVDRAEVVDLSRQALRISRDEQSTVDFDDMVWYPAIFDWRCQGYERVFIDETQDLNAAQICLALKSCLVNGRICAVGDDKQAIYGFRGADQAAMPRLIAELNAKVLGLTTTYRCAKSIAELAARYVTDFQAASWAPIGEVREIVGYREIVKGAAPGDFILSRTNAPLISLTFQFLREGRKVSIQGRDIGARLRGVVVRSGAGTAVQLCEKIQRWRDLEVERLEKLERDTASVIDTAECLFVLAEGCATTDDVLAKIESLFTDDEPSARRIVLSSTHKAKGLERDRVWLLRDTYLRGRRREGNGGVVSYDPPSQEEINLFYVAVTRAKNTLVMVREAK